MKRRIKIIEEIISTEESKFLTVELYYSLGGMNMMSYKDEPRGYYLSSKVQKIERKDGYSVTTTIPTQNYKILVRQSSRFSQKTLESIVRGKKWDKNTMERLIEATLKSNQQVVSLKRINELKTRVNG